MSEEEEREKNFYEYLYCDLTKKKYILTVMVEENVVHANIFALVANLI